MESIHSTATRQIACMQATIIKSTRVSWFRSSNDRNESFNCVGIYLAFITTSNSTRLSPAGRRENRSSHSRASILIFRVGPIWAYFKLPEGFSVENQLWYMLFYQHLDFFILSLEHQNLVTPVNNAWEWRRPTNWDLSLEYLSPVEVKANELLDRHQMTGTW